MFVYFQLFVYFSQKNHLEASNTKISQSKDVLNENLEYLRRSAVYLLSAVCLLFTKKAAYDASNTKISQSKDVWNENLEFLRWSAV